MFVVASGLAAELQGGAPKAEVQQVERRTREIDAAEFLSDHMIGRQSTGRIFAAFYLQGGVADAEPFV